MLKFATLINQKLTFFNHLNNAINNNIKRVHKNILNNFLQIGISNLLFGQRQSFTLPQDIGRKSSLLARTRISRSIIETACSFWAKAKVIR